MRPRPSPATPLQRAFFAGTLAAAALVAVGLWYAQRPAPLPPGARELVLPVQGLH